MMRIFAKIVHYDGKGQPNRLRPPWKDPLKNHLFLPAVVYGTHYNHRYKEIHSHQQNKGIEKAINEVRVVAQCFNARSTLMRTDFISLTSTTVPPVILAEKTALPTANLYALKTYCKVDYWSTLSHALIGTVACFAHRWKIMVGRMGYSRANFNMAKRGHSQNIILDNPHPALLSLNNDFQIKFYLTGRSRNSFSAASQTNKSNHMMWTVSLANNKSGFASLITPVHKYGALCLSQTTLTKWKSTGSERGNRASESRFHSTV